jgi:drug/metabolite transporter (DMT)-like permease
MDASDLISYAFAVVASFGNALANVMQRKAALRQAHIEHFGLRVVRALIRDPVWLIGFLGMVASFVFQAAALGLGQLSAVEPIITLEVPLTLLVASRVFNRSLTRDEWFAIGLMTLGMIVLLVALDPRPGNDTHVESLTYVAAGGATAATIALLLVLARSYRANLRTACLGVAAGTTFGLTATLIKETVDQLSANGVIGMLTTWQTYAAVGTGVFGVLVMQSALHSGPLLAAQPGFTLMDPLVSILWGVLVYNETVRSGSWVVLAAAGGVAIAVGVLLLARSPLFTPDRQGVTS